LPRGNLGQRPFSTCLLDSNAGGQSVADASADNNPSATPPVSRGYRTEVRAEAPTWAARRPFGKLMIWWGTAGGVWPSPRGSHLGSCRQQRSLLPHLRCPTAGGPLFRSDGRHTSVGVAVRRRRM